MPTDYKQTDPRWNTIPYAGENINNAGCGCTAVADLLNVTPDKVAAWMTANGGASSGMGTYWWAIPAALRAWGKESEQLVYSSMVGVRESAVFRTFMDSVASGFCGIMLFGNGGSPVKWTNSGHYCACVDYRNGYFLIYDPASSQRTGWHPWSDFIPSVKILYTSNVLTISGESKPEAGYAHSFVMAWLHEGSTGERVRFIQKVWSAFGWYKGRIDGDFGKLMVQACTLCQKLHNLQQDGSCGLDTLRATLRLSSDGYQFHVRHVQKGSKGESVILLQCLLRADGYYTGAIDGDFGNITDQAVRAYQADNGLEVDGSCGTNTWKRIIGF